MRCGNSQLEPSSGLTPMAVNGVRKRAGLRRERDVRISEQRGAHAHADAVDRHDDGLRIGAELVQEAIGRPREVLSCPRRDGLQLVEVGTGAERFGSRTRQHHHAEVVAFRRLAKRRVQPGVDVAIDRVALVGTVDRDDPNAVLVVDADAHARGP